MTYALSSEAIHELTAAIRKHNQTCQTCSGFLHFAKDLSIQGTLTLCEDAKKLIEDALREAIKPASSCETRSP